MAPVKEIALAALLGSVAVSGQDFPPELFFAVTYRDFLPSACFYGISNNTLVNIQKNAWDTNLTPNSNLQTRCQFLQQNAGWLAAIQSGYISGHPDFEADGQYSNSFQCTAGGELGLDNINRVNFPSSTCIGQRGSAFSIIDDTLAINEAGIPKPQYCKNGADDSCGIVTTGTKPRTQTKKKFFDVWYNDDLKFNKRIGQRLKLNLNSGVQGQYVFDSDGGNDAPDFGNDPNTGFFGPLDRFKRSGSTDKLNIADFQDDPRKAPAWPQSFNSNDGFWITTELHTTFEFRNDASMTFTFSGDDDFWAFVNGKLVLDLGGLHSQETASVDLKATFNGQFDVAQFLGLEDGGVYTLDIFHAERQTAASNFAITTTLFPTCNVIQSGTSGFDFTGGISRASFDARFATTRNVNFVSGSNSFRLISANEQFASSFIYTRTQENLGRGFIVKFKANVNGVSDGFAFVIQKQGIVDYPLSGTGNFNFFGVTNSLAVVFDLCADRFEVGSDCSEQTVSVHYPGSATQGNSFSEATKKTRDSILRELKTGKDIKVEIVFYGDKPNFLEVYIDDSLYLRENSVDITNILGGLGGHVGITATSGVSAAALTIKDFSLTTVEVDPIKSAPLYDVNNIPPQTVIADGVTESDGVSVQTNDFCDNKIEVGTLGGFFDVKYVKLPNITSSRRQEELQVVAGNVNDNDDGSYTLTLSTKEVGDFGLVFAFGQGCNVTVQDDGAGGYTSQLVSSNPAKCFFQDVGQLVTTLPLPDEPTLAPTKAGDDAVDNSVVVIVASTAGGLVFLGLVAGVVLMSYRRKWNREKGYVEDGNLYKLEANTRFQGADEYTQTGTQLLKTQEEILRLQAQGTVDPRTAEIQSLRVENEQMKTMIRDAKMNVNDSGENAANLAKKAKGKRGKVEL